MINTRISGDTMSVYSKILLGFEGVRALYEYGMGHALSNDIRLNCPPGDGHPVLVLPGFGTNDSSTNFIRSFLQDLGYEAYGWGLGRNLGPRNGIDELLNNLSLRLNQISDSTGNSVSIIGWSLGGIYGREIAKHVPDSVRQVITLGTPFKGPVNQGAPVASMLYELLSRDKTHQDADFIKRLELPPPVPFTSIYSKSDGIVHWSASIESEGPLSQNVEIENASHMGLAHNPNSLIVIADRLAQKKDTWKRYTV